MKVEIWSDVVCPWCYIGKRRFESAMARFDGAADVEVTWRSFQLNPTHPKGVRMPHDGWLLMKTAGTAAQVEATNQRVMSLAAAEGLAYDFERYQVINTFDAHRVAHLGAARGLGDAIQERLLRGQLVEGEVLDDAETLVRLAGEVGLPADDVRRVLETDAYAAEVGEDIREAHAIGVTGVPFFVLDRRYGVSGAQPAELFLEALAGARDAAATKPPAR